MGSEPHFPASQTFEAPARSLLKASTARAALLTVHPEAVPSRVSLYDQHTPPGSPSALHSMMYWSHGRFARSRRARHRLGDPLPEAVSCHGMPTLSTRFSPAMVTAPAAFGIMASPVRRRMISSGHCTGAAGPHLWPPLEAGPVGAATPALAPGWCYGRDPGRACLQQPVTSAVAPCHSGLQAVHGHLLGAAGVGRPGIRHGG